MGLFFVENKYIIILHTSQTIQAFLAKGLVRNACKSTPIKDFSFIDSSKITEDVVTQNNKLYGNKSGRKMKQILESKSIEKM